MEPLEQPMQQPPQQQIVSPEPVRRATYLPFALFGIVMLVVGLGGGYLLANRATNSQPSPSTATSMQTIPTATPTPSAQPTSVPGWQTYENTQLGISFQYPSDWKIESPFGTPSDISFVGLMPTNKTKGDSVTPMYVDQWANPKNLSLQAFEDEEDANRAMPLNLYSSKAIATTVAGVQGYIEQHENCEPLVCNKLIIMAKNHIFVFTSITSAYGSYSADDLIGYGLIFNRIIDTVKLSR